jgi:hypothetical protein
MRVSALLLSLAAGLPFLGAAESPRLDADANQLGVPFDRYTVKDAFDRTITFYLSPAPQPDDGGQRPVACSHGCSPGFSRARRRAGDSGRNPFPVEKSRRPVAASDISP